VIERLVKLYVYVLRFFRFQKNMTFYDFELLHTFSRTLPVTLISACVWVMAIAHWGLNVKVIGKVGLGIGLTR